MARKADDTDADIALLEQNETAVYVEDVTTMTYEELLASARDGNVAVRTADEFDTDDGFLFVADKSQLVDSEFIIVEATYFESDTYGLGVKVKVVTNKGNRVKFVDFGTGIRDQLKDAVNEDGTWPERQVIAVLNGLVKSEYGPKKDDEGNVIRPGGITFYLDTSGGRLPAGTL